MSDQDNGRDEKGRWKKGVSGNTQGPDVCPPEVRAARKFTKQRYDAIQHKLSAMSVSELQAVMNHPDSDVLEIAIASVYVQAIKRGDVARLETFTNRMIGPVPKKLEVTGQNFAEVFAMAKKHEGDNEEDSNEGNTSGS